ncbi:Glycosyltransferase involved in cell wall bisynthesis [Pustulibacterium marinum]|uniref:Glycosyltransferase involved in cell wall bisynthesis n=1 Tax=Pustulibacterium marinum TaxID=1224947 RepID=A0A1I7GE58_9FLAO|nr:glycosyltransferase [Pustulibacterium marinum]SFU46693.1 Glycosyltransferase involved in cell wall bisynthesis [Pustulibacterium marinum]
MKERQDIVCIANTTWFGEYTKSTVQLMSRLAKNHRVIFVEYPFTIKDMLNTFRKKQHAPVKRMLNLEPSLEKIKTTENTEIYHLVVPPVLPVDFIKNDAIFQFFFQRNIQLYQKRLRKVFKKLAVKDPIVISAYNPFYGLSMIGKLNQKLNIYYCYDGIGTRRHGPRIFGIDEQFSKKCDAIITTSDFINSEKKKWNPNSFVVKNGVDFESFVKEAKKDVHQKSKKIVGYIGSLDHRFDIETMEKVIQQLPNYEFHFTGNLRNEEIKKRLEVFENVQFFGAVKPNEVPGLLASYDVGIIPYLVNEINKNIYPLKINEYMAVGVPVVMTPFAELKDFEGMISVAGSSENFATALQNEIEQDSKDKIAKRIAFAAQNSWDAKAKEFNNIIEQLLETNGNRK